MRDGHGLNLISLLITSKHILLIIFSLPLDEDDKLEEI
jgi:hypothetical protein